MGYSSSELFGHILRERNRPDFYELLVHLVVTNILLIFSYFGNLMRIGSLVILANTFSDVFVYIAKALVDTKLTGGALSYIPLLVVYVWCRIYLHAAVVMKSVWKEAPALISNPAGLANWHYFYFLLSVILMMHMYWMFVIFKIGLFLLSTGKSRDLQACLSSLNVRQQIPHGVHTNPSATSSMEDVKSVTTAASEKKRAVRRR
jgi:acyl-CoA-dependent ceramide synthase